jgi:hypothetical protein
VPSFSVYRSTSFSESSGNPGALYVLLATQAQQGLLVRTCGSKYVIDAAAY